MNHHLHAIHYCSLFKLAISHRLVSFQTFSWHIQAIKELSRLRVLSFQTICHMVSVFCESEKHSSRSSHTFCRSFDLFYTVEYVGSISLQTVPHEFCQLRTPAVFIVNLDWIAIGFICVLEQISQCSVRTFQICPSGLSLSAVLKTPLPCIVHFFYFPSFHGPVRPISDLSVMLHLLLIFSYLLIAEQIIGQYFERFELK